MLLKDNKKKERKEKIIKAVHLNINNSNNINKSKTIIDNNIEYVNNKAQETNISNKEETDNCNCCSSSQYENNIEVIPELQINELFLYWINLPNTQHLIHKYLKNFGIKKDILNKLDNCYFNPYKERLEKSEQKKNELLDLQKFIFSIDNSFKNNTYSTNNNINNNYNNNNNNNNRIYHPTNHFETETDTESVTTETLLNIKKKETTKEIITSTPTTHSSKTLQRERRKVRKLDSSTNTYINHLSTSLHKNYDSNNHEIGKETKEEQNTNQLNNNNETELTEIRTESKDNNIYNKVTEKTMDNILLVEQTKNELKDNFNNNNTIEG